MPSQIKKSPEEDPTRKKLPSDTIIWHYRNFSEFTAILETKGLWLTRVDKLKDRFEGRSEMPNKPAEIARHEESLREMCVNCWTIDDHDSELMWASYARQSGVAIRSTAGRLHRCLWNTFIVFEKIVYGSLEEHIPFQKRRRFEREQEYRAIHIKKCDEPGLLWKIEDLGRLIEEVWISPYNPDWFAAVVKQQLVRYGLPNVKVFKEAVEVGLPDTGQSAPGSK